MDIDRHGPRLMPNNCKNLNPPNFSLPSTVKGRWKRETMRIWKESNVRQWSRTVAIEVYFQFEHAVFEQNVLFPFPLVTAKWIGDLFDKKRCESNKIFPLTTRQFICAPNVRSVKRDAARTRKKSASSNLVHNLRYEFCPHRHWRSELWSALAKLFVPHPLVSELSLVRFAGGSGEGNVIFIQGLRVRIVNGPRSPRSGTIA